MCDITNGHLTDWNIKDCRHYADKSNVAILLTSPTIHDMSVLPTPEDEDSTFDYVNGCGVKSFAILRMFDYVLGLHHGHIYVIKSRHMEKGAKRKIPYDIMNGQVVGEEAWTFDAEAFTESYKRSHLGGG